MSQSTQRQTQLSRPAYHQEGGISINIPGMGPINLDNLDNINTGGTPVIDLSNVDLGPVTQNMLHNARYPVNNGIYEIRNPTRNKCLRAFSGTGVDTYGCGVFNQQPEPKMKWKTLHVSGNKFMLESVKYPNRCLYAQSGNNHRSGFGLGTCTPTYNDQHWKFERHNSSDQIYLKNAHSNRCLYSTTSYVGAANPTCSPSTYSDQRWTIKRIGTAGNSTKGNRATCSYHLQCPKNSSCWRPTTSDPKKCYTNTDKASIEKAAAAAAAAKAKADAAALAAAKKAKADKAAAEKAAEAARKNVGGSCSTSGHCKINTRDANGRSLKCINNKCAFCGADSECDAAKFEGCISGSCQVRPKADPDLAKCCLGQDQAPHTKPCPGNTTKVNENQTVAQTSTGCKSVFADPAECCRQNGPDQIAGKPCHPNTKDPIKCAKEVYPMSYSILEQCRNINGMSNTDRQLRDLKCSGPNKNQMIYDTGTKDCWNCAHTPFGDATNLNSAMYRQAELCCNDAIVSEFPDKLLPVTGNYPPKYDCNRIAGEETCPKIMKFADARAAAKAAADAAAKAKAREDAERQAQLNLQRQKEAEEAEKKRLEDEAAAEKKRLEDEKKRLEDEKKREDEKKKVGYSVQEGQPDDDDDDSSGGGLAIGIIVLIVLGAVVCCVIVGGGLWYKKKKDDEKATAMAAEEEILAEGTGEEGVGDDTGGY